MSIPGAEGDFTAMPNHAPFLATLRPGVVRVQGGAAQDYVVTGGFAEVTPEGASVLAEEAVPLADVQADFLEKAEAAAAAALEAASEAEEQIVLGQRVNDFKQLRAQLGV